MREILLAILQAICKERGYLCCVAALSSGEQVIKIGDFSALRWRSLANALFGDTSAIIKLNEDLKHQILPQVYGQGEVFIVVMKPLDNLIVGLFHQGAHNPGELYKEGKKLSQTMT